MVLSIWVVLWMPGATLSFILVSIHWLFPLSGGPSSLPRHVPTNSGVVCDIPSGFSLIIFSAHVPPGYLALSCSFFVAGSSAKFDLVARNFAASAALSYQSC